MREVRIEIGEVVVRGLGAVDAARVRAAAVRELDQAFGADAGLPRAQPGRTHVDAGGTPLRSGASAEEVGAAVARAVRRGLA